MVRYENLRRRRKRQTIGTVGIMVDRKEGANGTEVTGSKEGL